MATDDMNGVALIERGYNEATRCLNFQVSFAPYGDGPKCALSALRIIDEYNLFAGNAVAQALAPFLTDDIAYRVRVGRESSPVLYLTVRPDVAEDMRDTIVNALRDVHADELDWTDNTLRAWWD